MVAKALFREKVCFYVGIKGYLGLANAVVPFRLSPHHMVRIWPYKNFGSTEESMWMLTLSPCKVHSSSLNTSAKDCSNCESFIIYLQDCLKKFGPIQWYVL